MEHPEDYKLRKRYEADRASGIAPGSMAQWMNDTAFKGLTTKLEAHRERRGKEEKSLIHTAILLEKLQKQIVILQNIKMCQKIYRIATE